jgi:hypothetical protein
MNRFSIFCVAAFFFFAACHHRMATTPQRDINAVLNSHSQELMAKPGVVGVYVGLMPDAKTQCIKVMLKDAATTSNAKLPKELEGYPVQTEITGEIRPLK